MSGCSQTDMGTGIVSSDTESKQTNSTADDKEFYDEDGKIILLPQKKDKDGNVIKENELPPSDSKKDKEKADFSDASLSVLEDMRADGQFRSDVGSMKSALAGAKPETVAGLKLAVELYNEMFGSSDVFGIFVLSSGTGGTHSPNSLHYSGNAIDMWGDAILDKDVGSGSINIGHPLTMNPNRQVNIQRHEYINALNVYGIRVLDETEMNTEYSSGPHLHMEFGDFTGGSILMDLFDGLKNIGDILSVFIHKFTDVAMKGYSYLFPHILSLVWVLAVIDIAATVLLNGMEVSLMGIIVPRIIKYGAVYGVLMMWPTFVNIILQTVTQVTEIAAPDQIADIEQTISQPQLIIQKGLFLIQPGFQFISSLSLPKVILNAIPVFLILVSAIITMIALMGIALYIAIVYIEFFVGAALSAFMIPMASVRYLKFLAEGAGSWLINNGIKILTMSLMTGMVITTIVKDANNQKMIQTFQILSKKWKNTSVFEDSLTRLFDAIKTVSNKVFGGNNVLSVDSALIDGIISYMTMCALICFLCYLIYRCTESISSTLKGSFNIPD